MSDLALYKNHHDVSVIAPKLATKSALSYALTFIFNHSFIHLFIYSFIHSLKTINKFIHHSNDTR